MCADGSEQIEQSIAALAGGMMRAQHDQAWPLFEAAWVVLERFIRVRLLSARISQVLLEDCGQNVLTRVWRFRTSYAGRTEGEFWGWLRRICDNERRRIMAREARRRHQRIAPDELLDDPSSPLGVRVEPDDDAMLGEHIAALRQCLVRLDAERRRVIELAYFDPPLTERAIAELIGCSSAHVHVLKRTGLRLLEACLRRKGVE